MASFDRKTTDYLNASQPRQNCWNALPVNTIFVTEAALKLVIFFPDHDRAGDDGESRQREAYRQPCSERPRGQLAEVSEINGMPNPLPDSRGHKTLTAFLLNLGHAAKLLWAEFFGRMHVEPNPDCEDCDRGNQCQ